MSTPNIDTFTKRYSGKVSTLFTLGHEMLDPIDSFSYRSDMGIDESDTEQLLKLANDMDIYRYVYDESDKEAKEFFGVIHAWRALSELAVPEGKAFFQKFIVELDDPLFDDWMLTEFRRLMVPYRYGMFEESVEVIKDLSINKWVRLEYLELVRDMLAHGEVPVVDVNSLLTEIFATSKSPVINAFAIGICTDNQLTEHYEAIAKCYENDLVDIDHWGDLEDVEIKFGMKTERENPRKLTELQEQWQKAIADIDVFLEEDDEPALATHVKKQPKIGRNDPCPCGSGKKYKKCCMNK